MRPTKSSRDAEKRSKLVYNYIRPIRVRENAQNDTPILKNLVYLSSSI